MKKKNSILVLCLFLILVFSACVHKEEYMLPTLEVITDYGADKAFCIEGLSYDAKKDINGEVKGFYICETAFEENQQTYAFLCLYDIYQSVTSDKDGSILFLSFSLTERYECKVLLDNIGEISSIKKINNKKKHIIFTDIELSAYAKHSSDTELKEIQDNVKKTDTGYFYVIDNKTADITTIVVQLKGKLISLDGKEKPVEITIEHSVN